MHTLLSLTIFYINKALFFCMLQDNLNIFLDACRQSFGLKDTQLFDVCDLEDLSTRAIAE